MNEADEEPRWLPWLERAEPPAGLALLGTGFAAIGLGWLEASGTADVRIQMQDLISGGVGGLAMVLTGVVLLGCHVAASAGRRLEAALAAVTEHMASGQPSDTAPDAPQDVVVVSHASYHRPSCDLLADRASLTTAHLTELGERGLSACRVCQPEVAA